MRIIEITDTILRDAHQSLIATRMHIDDMLPALELLDNVGYYSLEAFGGATFDVCLRYLGESPWDRLRTLKKVLKKTPVQMLLRGQNLVGYRHYADDVVDAFVDRCAELGVDIFRVFDALNDIRNLERAVARIKQAGKVVEGTISYTVSPFHTVEQFVDYAGRLRDLGSDTICIKDMSGILTPDAAFRLVSALKQDVKLPVHLHTHSTSGMAPAVYYRAAQAGVDIVDCALSPFGGGASQPPTETMAMIFTGEEFNTRLDSKAMFAAAEIFEKVRQKYAYILDPKVERIDNQILRHQIPGGMISNLMDMLKVQKAQHRLDEVLREVVQVREDMGFPPLVTPSSQIVGAQAVLNVLTGRRYGVFSKEVQQYVKGMYGRPPAPINPDIQARILKGAEPIPGRPADQLAPEMDAAREAVKVFDAPEEMAVAHAIFPQVTADFLTSRARQAGAAT
jgi:pyruvate/oxaloacetate carboxyltransferase